MHGRVTKWGHPRPPHTPNQGSQIGDHRLSTSCRVVERRDLHCGDELVICLKSFYRITFEFQINPGSRVPGDIIIRKLLFMTIIVREWIAWKRHSMLLGEWGNKCLSFVITLDHISSNADVMSVWRPWLWSYVFSWSRIPQRQCTLIYHSFDPVSPQVRSKDMRWHTNCADGC